MDLPDAETWQRINAVLTEALDRPPGERASFLEAACAGEPQVQDEVRALLDAEREAPAFLDTDVFDFALPLLPDLSPDLSGAAVEGRRIGPYRLVRELGRGGMSTVFLAERTGASFEQQVALKLLPPALSSDALVQRFQQEQQIMASLRDPRIARLLDGGVTEEGQPYFALEYVEGRPIDAYCQEEQCSVDERLVLFEEVARAVQHAHRCLVVHRDLKPSNVLVTPEGAPKLLDFGIAKLLADHDLPAVPLRTRTGARWLTLPYAAPEQVRGEAVTTATDVYQLGVMLYELLAGRRPFQEEEHQDGNRRMLEDAVLERLPRPPSLVADAAAKETLRGDLDRIILKALRKEPERRYSSVEALVEDVERFRAGHPVRARRGTWSYRARKFAGRHRWGVTTTAAVVLLVAGFIAMLMRQQSETARQRDRARAEAAKAEQVSSFMVNLFEASDPENARGDTVTARTLLQNGMRRIEQLGDRPEVQAQMLEVMGQSHMGLGNYEVADSLLRRALRVRRGGRGSPPVQVASLLSDLGRVKREEGQFAAADSLLRRALAIQEKHLGRQHADVAATLNELGLLRWVQSDYRAAEEYHRRALAIRRAVHDGPHPDLAYSLNNLGLVLRAQGKYRAAEALFREAVAIERDQLGPRHPETTQTMKNLAHALQNQRKYVAADSLLREVVAINRDVLGNTHPRLAVDLNDLGVLAFRRGDLARADTLLREALAVRRQALGAAHPYVAVSLNNLARVLERRGHFAEAVSQYREAVNIAQEQFGDDHVRTAIYKHNLGSIRAKQGAIEEAETLTREALHTAEAQLPSEHRTIGSMAYALGRFLYRQDRPADAHVLLQRALRIRRADTTGAPLHLAEVKKWLGACLTDMGEYERAEELLHHSYSFFQSHRPRSTDMRETVTWLVDLYDAWGRPEKAAAWSDSLAVHASSS